MTSGVRSGARRTLEEITGHAFSDPALPGQALTHRSMTSAGDRHGWQRLEFLGDRMLGAAVAVMLYRQFPDASEGDLSMRSVELVRNETLAELARELGIDRLVVMSAGEERSGARRTPAVMADVMEALIGALYLDGGFDAVCAFVERRWKERMRSARKPRRDAKTRLQEWVLRRGMPLPAYRILDKDGPDHDPVITVEVSVGGLGCAVAQGRSRRTAEQKAARMLLAGPAVRETGS